MEDQLLPHIISYISFGITFTVIVSHPFHSSCFIIVKNVEAGITTVVGENRVDHNLNYTILQWIQKLKLSPWCFFLACNTMIIILISKQVSNYWGHEYRGHTLKGSPLKDCTNIESPDCFPCKRAGKDTFIIIKQHYTKKCHFFNCFFTIKMLPMYLTEVFSKPGIIFYHQN